MDEPMTDLLAFGGLEDRRRSSRIQASWSARSCSLDISAQSTPPPNSSSSTAADKLLPGTPTEHIQYNDPNPTPSKRPGLRLRHAPIDSDMDPLDEAMKPLTDHERQTWKGWVELESNPALFNFILRQYGVKGVKVQEIFDLGDNALASLPKPVYGLIFLFQYRDDDGGEEEEEQTSKYPKHVWFANQTINNACATIALLNIIMNFEEIDLGEKLTAFKSDTRKLKPAYRGQKLGQDAFIRNIHNSFARRMDMLNADLALSNEMERWKRAKKNPKKPAKAKKLKKIESEDDSGFHFIAYVPINGVVWRLDGLQRQPVNLGNYEQDWMAIARDNILERISQHDTNHYSLLSLCKNPLLTIPYDLAKTIRAISAAESALTAVLPDWKLFLESKPDLETGPNESYGLSFDIFEESEIPVMAERDLNLAGTDANTLLRLYGEWSLEQTRLKTSYVEEAALIGQEDEEATRLKHDYTPIIYNSVKTLADEGILKEVIKDIRLG